MPSLRKSSRKSQTNTPYATPVDANSPASDAKKEKTQSYLDGWIEPPPKNPAPSFEEHGLARHGVLETMAPLGVPPTAKMKQRARGLAEPLGRRSFLGKNGSLLVGDEGASTPEMTPAPELEREDSERQEDEDELPPSFNAQDEEDDDDYIPAKSKGKANTLKTPIRGKTPVQSKTPVHNKTPIRNGVMRPSTAINSASRPNAPTVPSEVLTGAAKQRLTIAVNDAVARAKSDRKPHLVAALQQLHDESKINSGVNEIFQAIIHQIDTPEQLATFNHFIKERKKRAKREARLLESQKRRAAENYYSSPAAKDTANAPSLTRAGTLTGITGRTPTTPIVLSDSIDTVMDDAPALLDPTSALKTLHATPHPLESAPTLAARRSPSPPTARMPSKSPRKLAKANTKAASDRDAGNEVPTPTVKTPDSVVGEVTDSDLSDVNEDIVQSGPPEPLKTNGDEAATSAASTGEASAKKPKLAALRTGKKSRASSVKPYGKNEKKSHVSAEGLAEEVDIQQRRQELAEQQPARQGFNPPTSDIRFDEETLDTESLTESQYAVGPPTDANGTRRTARTARINTLSSALLNGKRLRDDHSPQVESAVTTRPSTPSIPQPTAKRLKLNNGQAARTKRSPIKNRDGPIAGIAHTGGGGSRQLGPDDNDPGSPPSESDDFCSACKGAGEFVCCDNCTRVYHFLCCDPPRLEPPTGSFLCHECEAKVRPTDTNATESFTVFGPLFKQLDSTNTRSFRLPSPVQTYFENVTSKDDGSYFEEVKKFPLSKSSGYGWQRPDYLRTHDAEHKTILCVQCGRSSAGKRQLLKCDFCHAYWHLDCCDPPLANPPHISLEAAQRDAWKCPRHIDHDLRSGLLVQNDLGPFQGHDVDMVDASAVRAARKVRKPKNPTVVEPTFSRGLRNNGLVEIINDPDDDTDGEGNYIYSPDESKDFGSKVFRIPEKGIIADFVGKVKHGRIEKRKADRQAAKADARRKASQMQFAARSIQEQQAALHLSQLANKEQEIGLNEQNVDALILTLTAEAPSNVVSVISSAEPGPLTDAKRAELVKLRELIDRALTR